MTKLLPGGGAIAGIVIGILVFVAIVVIIIAVVLNQKYIKLYLASAYIHCGIAALSLPDNMHQ